MQALVPLLAEDEPDTLLACWEALGAVTASIPKEMQPSFVRCTKVGFHIIQIILLTCSSSHLQGSQPCYGPHTHPGKAFCRRSVRLPSRCPHSAFS